MKMKEQNARLSVAGFYQMVVLGCTGGCVNEMLKDRSLLLIIVSSLSAAGALGLAFRIYLKVYRKFSNKK